MPMHVGPKEIKQDAIIPTRSIMHLFTNGSFEHDADGLLCV